MSYASEVLADVPLLWWRLDETAGTACADSSGNSRPGTYSATGVTYSAAGAGAATGTATTFNGSAGRIQSNATLDLSAFSAVTIECWMSVVGFGSLDQLLMETSANANSNNGAFYLDTGESSGAGRFSAMLKGAGGANAWWFAHPTTGVYHHYVFIATTGQAQAWTVRVDKVNKTMNALTSNSVSAFGNFTINAACRNAASLFLAATIDEIAIYGAALSTARTDAHFDAKDNDQSPPFANVTLTA